MASLPTGDMGLLAVIFANVKSPKSCAYAYASSRSVSADWAAVNRPYVRAGGAQPPVPGTSYRLSAGSS